MSELAAVLGEDLRPGRTVYVPGATGESLALASALKHTPKLAAGVHFVGCFVPGMNAVDYAGLDGEARLTTFMLPSAMRQSFEDGRVRVIPSTYSSAARTLSRMSYDVAFAQVSVPDRDGLCSLGIASDFAPLVWHRAARRILLVNRRMPAPARSPKLAISDASLVVEADAPLVEAARESKDSTAELIASLVAEIVPDHAAIQSGIGTIPSAIWDHLRCHKGLVLRSGLVPDGFKALAEAGALAAGGPHCAGIAYGSAELYQFLARNDLVTFESVDRTHDLAMLATCPKFHAINSALEVDLLGRINVAWQKDRLIGGVGGLPDFARAATAAPDGCSIIALPSTAKGGTISRIVPCLSSASVGLNADAIDIVVTEHGRADFRMADIHERAKALIRIAAPFARDSLAASWREMRKRL